MNEAMNQGARGDTLGDMLRDGARRFAASEIVFPQERCSYDELDRRADAYARVFRDSGVGHGQMVGIWLSPSIDMIAAMFGAMRCGGVAVPISDRFRSDELRHVITHGDLRVLVTNARTSFADRPEELLKALPDLSGADGRASSKIAPLLGRVFLIGSEPYDLPSGIDWIDDAGFTLWVHADPEVADATLKADDLAYLMYTSGTSAMPKGCMTTHRGCLLQGRSLAFTRYMLDDSCAFWCPMPLFHNAGLATMTAALVAGAKFAHSGQFDATDALRLLSEEKCTHGLPTFETVWMRILEHPEFPQADLSHLRCILNTGGEDLLRKLQARTPQATQMANYGMTEGTGHVSMTTLEDSEDIRMTTGGFPLPQMEVRIVDAETRQPNPPGERGEIQFRGPSRFVGYYKDKAATDAVIDADGWFSSGDLGVMDAEGRLTYKGRLKDMLKVGGENVAALEIESFLLRHPAVSIAAVVAAPDGYYSEVPAAYVQLAPGQSVTEEELIDFCLDDISTFKVPRYVRFVDDWPMSGTKIKKYVLRERIAAELEAAGIQTAPKLVSRRARGVRTG
ncbi:class I adenylate-forming enzyme family protein [Marinibacterium sp. SX1]|uniref:class I adenylate-forming enzyme family protein n=1 Tax=Marinibacterium sp. SX1 TaxID=3388424 RepID=UPI003D171F18